MSYSAGEQTSSRLSHQTKENLAIAAAFAASGALALGILGWSHKQDEGIHESLRTAASDKIIGFSDVTVDGTIINFNEGSLHGATVRLRSGPECSIQFTTVADSSIVSQLAPNHAKIVSYGTCPTDIPG